MRDWISIARLSLQHFPDPTRRYLVLQAYLDGANKPTSRHRTITLAAMLAPEGIWTRFEHLWEHVLDKHHLSWWHTSDAMSPEGSREFLWPDHRDSWTPDKAREVKQELWGLIWDFQPRFAEDGYQVLATTLDLNAYRRMRGEVGEVMRDAEAVCVRRINQMLWLPPREGKIHFVFDQGEGFQKQIEQVQARDKKKKDPTIDWARRIHAITSADARCTLPLQAADLVAWETDRAWRTRLSTRWLFKHRKGSGMEFMGEQHLRAHHSKDQEVERAEGIRRNREQPTREVRALERMEEEE